MKKTILFIIVLFCTFLGFSRISANAQSISCGIVNTGASNLNVRTSSSTTSTIKDKLSDSSYVTIYNEAGNFYYVEYKDDTYGYVSKDYVKKISGLERYVNTGNSILNVRTGASTSYAVKDKLYNNERVLVLSSSGYWSKILYRGNKTGYVYNTYLISKNNYSSIKLSVPSYKQYDNRWANTYIGSSGKTMKQIGCLTTAMSMTESYRTNSTITPAVFARNNSYTSNGSLYWPYNYVQNTSSTNYLANIYTQLKNGKPVILGCKNSTNDQHWVVVYGYNGGNKLQSSSFLIHDPGSSTRTTLSQFISAYPKFYKYSYYK